MSYVCVIPQLLLAYRQPQPATMCSCALPPNHMASGTADKLTVCCCGCHRELAVQLAEQFRAFGAGMNLKVADNNI